MKPSRRAGCGCLAALLVCLHGIVTLAVLRGRFSRPAASPTPAPLATPRPRLTPRPPPTPDPERYLERVPRRGLFRRDDDGERHRLIFGFFDHHGRSHDLTCVVDKRAHARELAWFGFNEREMDALVDNALARRVQEELAQRGLAPHVAIHFHDGGSYRWTSRFESVSDASELSRLIAERERWKEWMKRDFSAEGERIRAALYKAGGFLLQRDGLSPDYEQLAVRATPALEDCFRALEASGTGSNERQRLGLYLAFFQELGYERPPDRAGGRYTGGLWVPTEVLVGGRGDCDSKSAAFCAIWRKLPPRVVLIMVPGHALIGVEGAPGPQESFVRLGNRYFILCEVAGPAKWHPGRKPISGSFQYVAIPPASQGSQRPLR